jgi:repressor LexA
MSAEQLAEKVNLSPATIYRYEKGDIEKVPADILKKVARALNSSPAYLMGWESENKPPIPAGFQPLPKRDRVPRVGQIACGEPITAEENIDAYDEVPSAWHADFTLLCQGDSMEPKIKDSDIVAIHSQPMVENGQIAAVLIDGEATLKRVFIFGDHIELRAENPAFPTIIRIGEAMNDITIEGKAVGLCRNL